MTDTNPTSTDATDEQADDHFVTHTFDQAPADSALRFENTETDESRDVARIDGRIVKVHERTGELFVVDRAFVGEGLISPAVEYDTIPLADSRIPVADARDTVAQADDHTATPIQTDD